jgi:hypothetical protein
VGELRSGHLVVVGERQGEGKQHDGLHNHYKKLFNL